MKACIGGVIVGLGVLYAAHAAAGLWEGKRDNKSVDELSLMDMNELINEVSLVCVPAAVRYNSDLQLVGEARDYLNTVVRVARRNPATDPAVPYIYEALAAIHEGNASQCNQLLQKYYDQRALSEQNKERGKKK